jgi:4-hydroxybenzoate polyprenyltransferase
MNERNPLATVLTFFACALLLYVGATYLLKVWWVLLIVAVIVAIVVIYIRFKKGKPKY